MSDASRYDASFRKMGPGGETHFIKIGVAFRTEKDRIRVILDALPVGAWDGTLMLFPKQTEGRIE